MCGVDNPKSNQNLFKHTLHKLNNCLFVISGRCEMLMENDLCKEAYDDLKAIAEQVEKMRAVINEAGEQLK